MSSTIREAAIYDAKLRVTGSIFTIVFWYCDYLTQQSDSCYLKESTDLRGRQSSPQAANRASELRGSPSHQHSGTSFDEWHAAISPARVSNSCYEFGRLDSLMLQLQPT